MRKIDLHTHSTASDGIYSPKELIKRAIAEGVSTLALTDHDTVSGIHKAFEYAEKVNFQLISGIEFSVKYKGGTFHLVGLFIDHNYRPLLQEIERLSLIRDNRAESIIKELNRLDYNISIEEVEEISGEGVIGRPHIARALVNNGYSGSVNDVFKDFLVPGKPGYVSKERIGLDKAVELIKGAGGFAVIAHPNSLNIIDDDKFDNFIDMCKKSGVSAIEVYVDNHEENDILRYNNAAKRHGLTISGGSDFHGDKDKALANYISGKVIPGTILDQPLFLEYLKN